MHDARLTPHQGRRAYRRRGSTLRAPVHRGRRWAKIGYGRVLAAAAQPASSWSCLRSAEKAVPGWEVHRGPSSLRRERVTAYPRRRQLHNELPLNARLQRRRSLLICAPLLAASKTTCQPGSPRRCDEGATWCCTIRCDLRAPASAARRSSPICNRRDNAAESLLVPVVQQLFGGCAAFYDLHAFPSQPYVVGASRCSSFRTGLMRLPGVRLRGFCAHS